MNLYQKKVEDRYKSTFDRIRRLGFFGQAGVSGNVIVGPGPNKWEITDERLPKLVPLIREIDEVSELSLCFTGITDAGLPALESLDNVKVIRITYTKATQAGLKALEQKLPDVRFEI